MCSTLLAGSDATPATRWTSLSHSCQAPFQLSGSGVRLCLPSGAWSGEPAECKVKTCRPMQPPTNGYVSCSTHNYEVDTTCEFG